MRNTAATELDPIEQLLLKASVTKVYGPDIAALENLVSRIHDWEMFVSRADSAHLSPLLSKSLAGLADGIIPSIVLKRLTASYHAVLLANVRMYSLFEELVHACEIAGIEVIPLKGIHLAEKVYGDIGLRHLSDIDILVRPSDMETIKETASLLGWKVKEMHHHSTYFKTKFGSHHPFKLLKGNTVVELHVHVHGPGSEFTVNIDDYWHHTTSSRLSGCAIRQLEATDMLQHLCLHLYKHLQAMELKMSSFCDIRELLRQQTAMDWDVLMKRSCQYGIDWHVGAVLFLCREFWGCDVPDAVLKHVPTSECERCTTQFLTLFIRGRLRQDERGELALAQRLYALKAAPNLKGKLRFIQGYVMPNRAYLEQCYGNGHSLLLLRASHLWSLTAKTLRVVARRFTGWKAIIL